MRRRQSLILIVAAAIAAALIGAHSATACGKQSYAYAGVTGTHAAAGIGAAVSTLSLPRVAEGHVAAFVGVGGPGLGPGGSDEWLQIGLSGFAGGVSSVYYEVARPGQAPLYTELKTDVRPGETHRIAVLEQRGRADWWRVWLDGHAASRPMYLPGSHGRWTPMATAESWTPGHATCNAYSFRFRRVSIAAAPGSRWQALRDHYTFNDAGYRIVRRSDEAFVAMTAPGAQPSRQLFSVRG